MDKKATILDVAKMAGVSVATASRVVSGKEYPVSAESRKRVLAAAESLSYVPNETARALRGAGANDIALVIPNVSNPFYLQTMLGINDVLKSRDYNLILCNTMRDIGVEHRYLSTLTQRQVKGIILSSVDKNSGMIERCAAAGMRFVLLDQKFDDAKCMGIEFDSMSGGRMATQHLIENGHRRIAFATLPMTRWTRIEIYRGYRETMEKAGIIPEEKWLLQCEKPEEERNGDVEIRVGQMLAEEFISRGMPCSAIVCINDMLAIGLIQTLIRHGVHVPEDVSVIGFDDIPLAGVFLPALTTVRYPAFESGRLSAMMLLDTLESGSTNNFSMSLRPELIQRETVCRAQ